ncbi:catalase-related domain-containing protein [Amycolatopsis circi]|uniref:catalase-related domain-containing protein n=1 Tax=Amycolatopsis circi TaxID=871959 RepID=UPI001FC926D8|nr:catalase-related domain-containing protein [Amycolatopsis circi]
MARRKWFDRAIYAVCRSESPFGIRYDLAAKACEVTDRFDYREDDDNYFEQPGNLFRLLDEGARQRLFENTARGIKGARRETVERHIDNCAKADPAYGAGVRKACEEFGAL